MLSKNGIQIGRLSLLILIISFSSLLNATNSIVANLQQLAEEKQLWEHPEWINLLHYNKEGFFDNYISQVDDDRFFKAEDGKTNPKSELLETIAAFYRTDIKGNEHPRCHLVSRLNWLKQQLAIDEKSLPRMDCKDYKEWRGLVQADHITMIFPAYHLNSPSSMFGHTLFRLDKKINGSDSEWLSYAVNFGADTTTEDNSILYAFKGLAGGYQGIFIVQPYFKKIQEYNRIENRDIWEYSLNLNKEETERLITHLWELKEMNFDYFFFDENCSYRLLELLEVARPGIELTDEYNFTVIPVDTVRSTQRTNMIDKVEYRPSQSTQLQALIDQMPEEDHELVIALSKSDVTVNEEPFLSYDTDRKRLIVDAAYKYLRYQEKRKVRTPEMAKLSHRLLEILNQYPSQKQEAVTPRSSDPGKSHLSRRVSPALGSRNKRNYAELSYKMSFHDLEDNVQGFLPGAQINMGNYQLRAYRNGDVRLHQFDIVDIFSITPRTEFFDPLTWRVYTGMERQPNGLRDHRVSHVTGGFGVAYELWENSQFYSLGILRLEHNTYMNNSVEPALGILTGLLHHFDSSTMHLELSGEEFKDDFYRTRGIYTHNFVISTNHSLKITAAREWHSTIRFSEFNLAYQYYF